MSDGDAERGLLLGRTLRSRQAMGYRPRAESVSEAHGKLVRYAGEGPAMTFAATGTGKTSGPVICNARTYPGQLICLDVKGEAHRLSAEHRAAMGQTIYTIDLRDTATGTDCLNPLDLARRQGSDLAAIARALAAEMIDRSNHVSRETFWVDWSETLLTAGIAYLFCHEEKDQRNLARLYDLYTQEHHIEALAVYVETIKGLNRASASGWAGFLALSEMGTRSSVMGSTVAHLRLFESEMIRRLTRDTTIDLDGFVAGKPMSIYITVPPHRIAAYAPVLRLWISGLLNLLTTRAEPPALPTLMLVDEAAQLGRMDGFVTAMTLMRGFGVKLWTFWQAASQLDIYGGQAKTMLDNAGVVQIFGVRNYRAAAELAALVGGIAPETILRMSADQQLVSIEGATPEMLRQMRYYSDPLFTGGPEAPGARR